MYFPSIGKAMHPRLTPRSPGQRGHPPKYDPHMDELMHILLNGMRAQQYSGGYIINHKQIYAGCIRIDKDVSEHLRNFSHLFISSGTNAADVNLSSVTKSCK